MNFLAEVHARGVPGPNYRKAYIIFPFRILQAKGLPIFAGILRRPRNRTAKGIAVNVKYVFLSVL
jgi:hypothetical protein